METLTILLGNKNYSSWSLRGYLALAEVGVAFDEVVVPLDQPETKETILRFTPSGRVPALRHGERLVWDSLAIGEYLNETYTLSQLIPRDPVPRAHLRSVVAEMHSGFAALRHDMPMNLRRSMPGVGHTPGALADLARIFAIWRDCRARFGEGGKFLFGRFTLADCFYAPVVTRCQTYGVALEGVCQEYADAILAHGPLQEWTAAAKREPWVIRDYEL